MVSAVIFDLDGTVLDNEGIWEEAFATIVAQNSIDTSRLMKMPNGWLHEPGIGLEANWKRLVLDMVEARELANKTRELYMNLVRETDLGAPLGLVELVEKIKEKGWQTALATGSSWNTVEEQLEQLSLALAFDVTTTGEEVVALKPDPEIYVLTGQKLNLEPAQIVVIEDAIAGIRAAAEAGMKTIGLASGYAPVKLMKDAGAGWVVEDMGEIWELLEKGMD